MKVYHVTYLVTLRKIAQEGLRPTRRKGIGGEHFAVHRRGAIFLTSKQGLAFWYDMAVDWADTRGKGLPPVILRTDKPSGCVGDAEGSSDADATAYKCSATIEPKKIEVFIKGKWVKVTKFSGTTLGDLKRIFEPERARTDWGIMESDTSPLFPGSATPKPKPKRKPRTKVMKFKEARRLVARALR